jgi:hypothetical protein
MVTVVAGASAQRRNLEDLDPIWSANTAVGCIGCDQPT